MLTIQAAVREVYVDVLLKNYIVAISEATRRHEAVYLGASSRGSLNLLHAAQARALLADRDYVTPDDVKSLAEPVLDHRLLVDPASRMKDVTGKTILGLILDQVAVPGARPRNKVKL